MRDYALFVPEYIAVGFALLVIAIELFAPRVRKEVLAYLTALGALAWFGAGLAFLNRTPESYQGLFISDEFTSFFRLLAAGIVFAVALMSAEYLKRHRGVDHGEFYGLLLIAGAATTVMAGATELLTAYLALEVLSFSLYILVGILRRDLRSNEASLKYILLGAFSSAILLYGLSLVYGATGTTSYAGIAEALSARGEGLDPAVIVGLMLILAGVGFKVSAAPFHMWAPDAYQGAPLPVTALLSTLSKAAGFALILRLFSGPFLADAEIWRWAFLALAAITMTVGNLVAIQQSNLKRLVAYSSVGQVGYMLIALAALGYGDAQVGLNATSGLLVHLVGYVVTTLALFAALTATVSRTGSEEISGLRGLSETQPFLALVITSSLFSFAGLPFFAGFATKLFLFQGATTNETIFVVGLAVLNSFISLYYYLMVIRQMYLYDPIGDSSRWRVQPVLGSLAAVFLIGLLFIGIYPGPAFEFSEQAARPLFEAAAAVAAQAP
jgi:proton-translocating NADH-quinone oxidoreductase chain N